MYKRYSTALAAIAVTAVWATATLAARAEAADAPSLTIFGWSDQHVTTEGDGSHLLPAIDAMNALPATTYPASIGGRVAKPAFVFGCGDIAEWPTNAAKNTYDKLISKRLKFPSYDIAGNHDDGGNAPSDTVHKWIVERHGALSYVFSKGGVHFIAVHSKYDESLNSPAQPVHGDALAFIRKTLAKAPKEKPVVVALHLCADAITNKSELVAALGDANVIAILGGHYHKAVVQKHEGVHFIQLPSPAPGSPSEVTVIRITPQRLVAIPYDYEKKAWATDGRRILDTPIKGPPASDLLKIDRKKK